MCDNPFDHYYTAHGGLRPRVDMIHGRMGSAFSDAGNGYLDEFAYPADQQQAFGEYHEFDRYPDVEEIPMFPPQSGEMLEMEGSYPRSSGPLTPRAANNVLDPGPASSYSGRPIPNSHHGDIWVDPPPFDLGHEEWVNPY